MEDVVDTPVAPEMVTVLACAVSFALLVFLLRLVFAFYAILAARHLDGRRSPDPEREALLPLASDRYVTGSE